VQSLYDLGGLLCIQTTNTCRSLCGVYFTLNPASSADVIDASLLINISDNNAAHEGEYRRSRYSLRTVRRL